jgi:hypothetical protein
MRRAVRRKKDRKSQTPKEGENFKVRAVAR